MLYIIPILSYSFRLCFSIALFRVCKPKVLPQERFIDFGAKEVVQRASAHNDQLAWQVLEDHSGDGDPENSENRDCSQRSVSISFERVVWF